MKYIIKPWTIDKLIEEHSKKNLNLTPSYQRNNIWTEKSQKTLISSIRDGLPLPTFFLHDRGKGKFDIADGQQRTRAILAYISGEVTDLSGHIFSSEADFLRYEIPVVIINESVSQEEIRQFYVVVNNTGLRLNRPELTKAQHFNTDVLKLVEALTDEATFQSLGIFNDKQSERMIDREFVEELVAQLYYGIGDKKNDIKKLYEEKFDTKTIQTLSDSFHDVVSTLSYHSSFDLANTRYAQRNDFYTLFGFIHKNKKINSQSYELFFNTLKNIQEDISPSNELNSDLQFYALNCVSQSNSKGAREDRLRFFEDLLLNKGVKPNKLQKSLLKYYKLSQIDLIKTTDGYLIINPDKIAPQYKK
jgi:hypothetical protein